LQHFAGSFVYVVSVCFCIPLFNFRCGGVAPQMGNLKRKRNGRFMKNSGPSKRQRLDDEKKTSTPASVEETKLSWKEGRRIVELGVLAEQLRSGCEDCKTPLFLHDVVDETKQGLGSILYVQCNCGQVTQVRTGKTHRDPKKKQVGRPIWDLNTKAATG